MGTREFIGLIIETVIVLLVVLWSVPIALAVMYFLIQFNTLNIYYNGR